MRSLLTYLRGGGPNKKDISSLSSNPCGDDCSGCCYFYIFCSHEMKATVWLHRGWGERFLIHWKLKSKCVASAGYTRLWFGYMSFYCLCLFIISANMTQLDFPGQAVYRIQHHIPMLVQMHKSTNEISCSYYYFYYYDATITFILSCYVKNFQFMCEWRVFIC